MNGNTLCHGLPPQARVWRRNAMNTDEHLCLKGKKQPAESMAYRIILP
ncbi:hypothetical protein [Kingella denitrificans]|nr:hypothetical protein [Kingella denitrificans]